MTPPTLLFLGHAGLLIRHAGVRLLCDPWLSESGAFLHTWHQFPPNDFVRQEHLPELHAADFLYLSHDHADHFDSEFLQGIPDKAGKTVLLADFIAECLREEVRRLGFSRIVTLPDWEELQLGPGFSVRLMREPSHFKTDSALLAEVGGRKILHRNDCHLSDADHARLRDERVDLMLSQFSGAMWYPAAYDYPPQVGREVAAGLRSHLLRRFAGRVNSIRPRHVIHAAGPPCFLEPDFFHLNFGENGIFYDQSDAFGVGEQFEESELHLALPGDTLRLEPSGQLTIDRARPFDFSRKRQVLMEYADRRGPGIEAYLASLPEPASGFLREFMRHTSRLAGSSRLIRERSSALARFRIAGSHGGVVDLDTRNGAFRVTDSPSGAANYEFDLDGRIARLLVEGRERWESVLLSLRFKARRDPDEYNWPLFALLRYGHDPRLIREIERHMGGEATETFIVRDGSDCYRIPRRCPHAGEDLSTARIQDGVLTCARHQWSFDLRAGGRCTSGGNIPLPLCERVTGTPEAHPLAVEDEEQEGEV